MITVEIKKDSTSSKNCFSELMNDTMKEALLLSEKHIEDTIKELEVECETHKENSKGTIIVNMNKNNNYKFECVGFCCNNFEQKVKSHL